MNGHGAPPCVRSVLGLPALLTITLPRNPSWPGRHRRMLRLLPDAQPERRKRTCDRPDVVLSCSSSPTPSKRWLTVSLTSGRVVSSGIRATTAPLLEALLQNGNVW